MNGLTIERLQPGSISRADFLEIVDLEANCGLPDPYPPELIAELLTALTCFVCRSGGRVVGFIMINGHGRYFTDSVYIVNINVDSAFRGRGVAKRLILEACRYYLTGTADRLMSLDVTLGNPALRLYEKIGFRRTMLPSRNGKTDIVMAAPLRSVAASIEDILSNA